MKKYFISGVLAIAISAVFTGCSKSTDLYDEGAVQQNQHEQEVAQLKKAYNDAFTKEFGSIAASHKWGFDKTAGATTRTSVNTTTEAWLIPDNFLNGRVEKEGVLANAVQAAMKGANATDLNINFNNYFLQHTDMPKNIKVSIERLEAYNSSPDVKDWEPVAHFNAGKNPNFDFEIEGINTQLGINRTAYCTTLMKDMGGAPDPVTNKRFRIKYTNGTYNYNYVFLTNFSKTQGPHTISGDFLGFYFDETPSGNTSYWVIKIAPAQRDSREIVKEGRVLCEDMGANDFDFNDIVFDAMIMGNGDIKIKVVAHGGILGAKIGGVTVTLPQMSNTGKGDPVGYQEFTIDAVNGAPKWSNIEDIPIEIETLDAENIYELSAPIGSAPQKICVPVNTPYPDEYVQISRAYKPFTSWVGIIDPEGWYIEVDPILTNLKLSDNN